MDVKELKESWAALPTVIEELEANGNILILRQKDGVPKSLFYNDKSMNVKMSEGQEKIKNLLHFGRQLTSRTEFRKYWHDVKLPGTDADLIKELEKAGMKSMESYSTVVKEKAKPKTKKRTFKRIKLTNTHLEAAVANDRK
ncbi:hypothetical protein HK104_003109 [Borealophlyctis nickersoniae]|nr:hypothetical protein HK104_003109 [Borealophlyctis nickersoniae]